LTKFKNKTETLFFRISLIMCLLCISNK